MAAPKKNEFWKLRSKHGRDKLFTTPELLWEAACEYFEWCEKHPITIKENKGTKHINEIDYNRPFTIEGFCLYCDASKNWFQEFRKAAPEDFLVIIHKIEQIIYLQKWEGAAIGMYKENLIARTLGLTDKKEVKQNTTIEYKNVSTQFPGE